MDFVQKRTRTSVFVAHRAGRPLSLSSTENIKKIQPLGQMDAKLSIRAKSSDTGINKETVRQILRNQLG